MGVRARVIDDPAFPLYAYNEERFHIGMTKREYFAGVALQGLLSCGVETNEAGKWTETCALYAVKIADALRVELAKENL